MVLHLSYNFQQPFCIELLETLLLIFDVLVVVLCSLGQLLTQSSSKVLLVQQICELCRSLPALMFTATAGSVL